MSPKIPERRTLLPLQDQARRAEELDPAYWDRLLSGSGESEDAARIYTHDQEADLTFGAEGADEMTFEWSDQIDRNIAKQLAAEGDHLHYAGAPENIIQLNALIRQLVSELRGRVKSDEDVVVAVHKSCVSGDACVIVAEKGKDQTHISTRKIERFSVDGLAGLIEKSYPGIRFVEKD